MFIILDIVVKLDPAVLVVSIGVCMAWDMAGTVYLYATKTTTE